MLSELPNQSINHYHPLINVMMRHTRITRSLPFWNVCLYDISTHGFYGTKKHCDRAHIYQDFSHDILRCVM